MQNIEAYNALLTQNKRLAIALSELREEFRDLKNQQAASTKELTDEVRNIHEFSHKQALQEIVHLKEKLAAVEARNKELESMVLLKA